MSDNPNLKLSTTNSFNLTDALKHLKIYNDTLSASKGFGEFTIKWNNGNMTYISTTQGFKP